ncbi:hypothetical protein [Intrasporangium sp. DVR]|uniref:hypothetical protein n=1 Tax=Intrasporangium sp. DVR TaxID=3127867 RepID=UPI003341FAB0
MEQRGSDEGAQMTDGQREAAAAASARDVLTRTEAVRRLARADQQGVAIPLLVLGPLTVVYAALLLAEQVWLFTDEVPGAAGQLTGARLALDTVVQTYWGTIGALGLIGIGLWFWWRGRQTGAGAGASTWIAAGVGVLMLMVVSDVVPILGVFLWVIGFLYPTALITLALLLVARRRHNGRLARWVLLFGVVTVLASVVSSTTAPTTSSRCSGSRRTRRTPSGGPLTCWR